MAGTCADHVQWLSINEEALFLHDGLIRVTDLVELPEDVSQTPESEHEVIAFDNKNVADLSDCISALCCTQNNAYAKLLEYRLNALRGLWNAQYQLSNEQVERENASQEEALAILKKQGVWQSNEHTSFASRLSLLLVFPLLQSQSKTDPSLCGATTQLLAQCLNECPPHSLNKEPVDCLNGLESLLCSWLGDKDIDHRPEVVIVVSPQEKETTASALVALASARGSIRCFVNTIHLLQNLPEIASLPVTSVLTRLRELEGGVGCWSSLLGNKHISCWGFEDMLTCASRKENSDKEKDIDYGRSLACDGKFLYATNSAGQGLAKIGSGYCGTLRGFVYIKNNSLGPGRVAWGNDLLLMRSPEFDNDKDVCRFAFVIDPYTLKSEGQLVIQPSDCPKSPFTTIQFCSDGYYFFWIWCPGSYADKSTKGQSIFLDVFDVSLQDSVAYTIQKRVTLHRKDETCLKPFNDTLLSRLRPYRSATATGFLLLSGSSSSSSLFGPTQDASGTLSAGTTSCGLPLKTLLRSPIYTCGNSVVVLTSSSNNTGNAAARSLFGSSSSLASLRSLATNLCFSVKEGLFVGRSDLIDAPTCGLARGAQLQGLGICYDAFNNVIWTCSNDWVDQYYNPGHQAAHHIRRRLGIDSMPSTPPTDNRLTPQEVIRQLLQHVGMMCCHQVAFDPFQAPVAMMLLHHHHLQQQQPADAKLLQKVLDILEVSVRAADDQMISCVLVVLQSIFKSFKLQIYGVLEAGLKERAKTHLWHLLDSSKHRYSLQTVNVNGAQKLLGVQAEACCALVSGLGILYPDPMDRNTLLCLLMTRCKNENSHIFSHLRDLVLMDLVEQLQTFAPGSAEELLLRPGDDLLCHLLQSAVEESCSLLRDCVTSFTTNTSREEFNKKLVSIPVTSPCIQYLSTLQNHLLRAAVLRIPADDVTTGSALQSDVLNFALKVFSAAHDVLEALLNVYESVAGHSTIDDWDLRLSGLERVAKATILGHLLPVLITSLTHVNLRSLHIADSLMHQLVRLVILASQVALHLKQKSQNISKQQQQVDVSSQKSTPLETTVSYDPKEGDLLDGLKIPAPWARGSTVESIHPVRDNYKFKETVHIPGARCLFLRFDPRCSSQYDYDKLILYCGPDTNSHKIAEYGGNTYGYGSRSVLGSGWPKDLVKVEGDTVTLAFEMRSGREHNTPDKAMWGFLVSVRAQESAENVSGGLPFLADIALGLSVLCCSTLKLLYNGPPISPQEDNCSILLKSRFMPRCVLDGTIATSKLNKTEVIDEVEEDIDISTQSGHCSSKHQELLISGSLEMIPPPILHKLRVASGCVAPQVRPSIRSVLQVDRLEEIIISAIMKHFGLTPSEPEERLSWLLGQAYRKLDSLIRRLQVLAELEQRWQSEVEDIRQGMMPANMAFFVDYHFSDTKAKELTMLCFLKGVDTEGVGAEAVVHNLRERLEAEAYSKEATVAPPFVKTRQLVATILQRGEILLSVSLQGPRQSYSDSTKSDNNLSLERPCYSRSLSAPCQVGDASVDQPVSEQNVKRKRLGCHRGRYSASILDDVHPAEDGAGPSSPSPPQTMTAGVLLDQVFSVVSSVPEKMVTVNDFWTACNVRAERGATRRRSLIHMKELLTAAAQRVGSATHLVAAVTSVLQGGPRTEELTASGTAGGVREAFSETVASVVRVASRYPVACCTSIGLLCVVPYTKREERCLVQSGLVHLLDRLCSLGDHRSEVSSGDVHTPRHWVSSMAWAGFQVLSNRCVSWETDTDSSEDEELPEAATVHEPCLAQQVAKLLTNRLARATDDESAGNEALQEVLGLLNDLSRSRMGRAILSQPTCVSKLLSLLLDQRPSPKLVLVILQLCRTALPLVTAEDCKKVFLPRWGNHGESGDCWSVWDVPSQIASLLLAKLGDYVIPGFQTIASSSGSVAAEPAAKLPAGDMQPSKGICKAAVADIFPSQEKNRPDEGDGHNGRLSVFLYKRVDQSVHDVIQPLHGAESRLFRLSGSGNVDRVERITRELAKYGRAEVCTEDALSALRRAAKWAQNGMVVSTGPAIEREPVEGHSSDKKKTTVEVVCKEKNAELVKNDPVRAFISGQVANSMASEVIALLHGLLTATTAEIWTSAVAKVLGDALAALPQVLKQIDAIGASTLGQVTLLHMARRVVAALCALGGFQSTLKPGSEITILGVGSSSTSGLVVNISEQQDMATVKLNAPSACYSQWQQQHENSCGPTFQVPLSRLIPKQIEPLPIHRLGLTGQLVEALRVLLRPDSSGKLPLQSPLPLVGEGSGLPMAICRIVAEIRTRACMVMALYLEDPSFASAFVQSSGAAVDALKCLAKECAPVHRHRVVEMRCHRLRMLYRDCAKPPPPPNRSSGRSREITWNTTRAFPPVRASLFSHGLTGITFLGDPSAGSGLPRGTFIYASHTVPLHAPSFYWELEVCSLGDPQEDGGPVLSFGFAPPAERKDGAWTNPVGTVLFHNNGRAVHYNGSSLLQWRSVRLDVTLAAGDVAGCGWERTGDTPELMAQSPKGTVFFTYNGQRLSAALEDVAGGMWPVVHLQKKNTRVKSNFGARPFAYAEGRHHIDAAHEASESAKEIRATFGILPFPGCSDSESDVGERTSITTPGGGCGAGDSPDAPSPPMVPPCRIPLAPRPCREYDMASSSLYRLQPSYSNLLTTGPDHQHLTTPQSQDDESDTEDIEDVRQQEDHYALLVKAWESRVFPVIRRRFRNEAERKDGLEQIRGALQLGMTDIAQQTVEFLYEENGGVPRDLHLPTIEDIKDEVSRFTMERIRKGTPVVVRHPSSGSSTTTVLPKFAVRAMLKTFGLPGIVLDVDNHNELVQVETYLRSEGVLVRFWYPLDVLERPAQDLRRTAVTGVQIVDTNSVQVHRELIRLERALARIYCRSALLRLVKYCESPEVSGGAIVPFFSELDVENLRLLSDRLLASSASSCRGSVLERSLTTCGSPKRAFAADSCLPSDLFHEDALSLQTELASTIYRVACHGEDYLMELTDQISSVVQLAPESFPREEMGTVESKTATDVHFPGASFLFVSVKGDPKAASISKRESSPPPSLQSRSSSSSSWARIYCYSGNDFKKNGRASRREVACYPRSSSVPNVDDPFLPLLLDCDCIHVRLSCRPPPGAALVIHAIPPQFPLALAYFEELLKVKRKELCSDVGYDQAGFLSPLVTSTVLLRVIELIGGYLWRTDVTPRLKECVFHLLAEYLRTTRDTNGTINGGSSLFSALGPQLSPSLALMLQLQSELRRLYDEESRTWTVSQVHQSSSGDHQQLRFSSYFHALMEVSLAIAEVTAPLGTPFLSGTSDSLGSRFLSGSPPPLASLSVVPSSPSSSSRRKKLKAKRDRDRASPKSRSCSSSPRGSVCETDQQPGPSGASLTVTDVSGSSKPEDALWFHRAVAMSEILRCLIDSGQQESSGIKDAVADAFQALVQSTAHSRLVVITGIPRHLSVEAVNQAIVGGLRDVGGIRGGEVYVPRTERDDTIGDIVRHRGDQRMGESSRNAGEDGTRRTAGDGNGDKQNRGFAVFETRSKAVVDSALKALFRCRTLLNGTGGSSNLESLIDEIIEANDSSLSMSTVTQNLQMPDPEDNVALDAYLKAKLFVDETSGDITDEAMTVITDIFHSCFIAEHHLSLRDSNEDSGFISLNKEQIMCHVQGNLLLAFLRTVRPTKRSLHEHIGQVLSRYGVCKREDKEWGLTDEKRCEIKLRPKKSALKKSYKELLTLVCDTEEKSDGSEKQESKDKSIPQTGTSKSLFSGECNFWSVEQHQQRTASDEQQYCLTLDGFIKYVVDRSKSDVRAVWQGLFACGYDLHFDRCSCIDVGQAQQMSKIWTLEMDCALVQYVNAMCRRLAIAPSRLHPHDLLLSQADLATSEYACLQSVPIESVRLRFSLLQSLNNNLGTFFLPLVDLRSADAYPHNTAAVLGKARSLIFYDTKVTLMNSVLNATAFRKSDLAAPEITLDPLETIGTEPVDMYGTQFYQAMVKLREVPSSQFCVQLASGGDPIYAFNVRVIGEEVHGTNGSFRQFLSQISRELQSSLLPVLVPCPSAAANRNKGKYILHPGPPSYLEEKMLEFFGQLLGIGIRANIPLPIDLIPAFWKSLVNVPLDPVSDLQEVDILTYNYIKEFDMVENAQDLSQLLEEHHNPHFVYTSLTGDKVELCRDGQNVPVSWENHSKYVAAIRELRMKELSSLDRYEIIKAGLASIIPIQLLRLFTPTDLELRTCGIPEIDLGFLKLHTIYQVGLTETEPHIRFFWNALESFSQEELRRFVKFACNQDRIPDNCPCKDGKSDTVHVPPYPMKIAPHEGRSGSPNSRYVRAETCMFMLKLPQYTTQAIMTERLLYAINCRDDPLSG